MDVSYLLDSLNDKQREAVAAPRSNLLVLAGAGSGKTRVLVHRIAWLMSVENCSPYSIMAVTFTNKAAAEMRHRIGQLMGTSQGGMWVGTFHGLAHRLLRAHHMDANLPQDFQILDSEDQLRLLKRLIKAMNLDEKQWPPRQAMWYINSQKDEGLRPHHIQSYGNPVEQTWQKVYQAYQEACDRAGLVDFAELLLRAHELWLNKPHILQHYRERFTNILVDEFQDTNNIQYAWIRLLAGDPSIALLTNSMKRVLWLTASKPGRTTAERLPSAPFSTAATPSRGCSKRRYCRPVCRTVFTAGCASSNARKSKMRSRICA